MKIGKGELEEEGKGKYGKGNSIKRKQVVLCIRIHSQR